MSVRTIDRRPAKRKYDYLLFKIKDDAFDLSSFCFGASKKLREEKADYISAMSDVIFKNVEGIETHIRTAYSIFPKTANQFDIRRTEQEKAIGLCFDLLEKYQDIFKKLHIPDDKYVYVIVNIIDEIKSLENWKDSDSRRFKF